MIVRGLADGGGESSAKSLGVWLTLQEECGRGRGLADNVGVQVWTIVMFSG